jgi:hypothetical protein
MGLMADDYLMNENPSPSFDELDRVFADCSPLALFNQDPDRTSVARLVHMFGRATPRLRNPAWTRASWQSFLNAALCMPFPVFFYDLALRLLTWSIVWGHAAE